MPKKQQTTTVEVRILTDHVAGGTRYHCNQVVTLDAEAAAAMVKAGVADDNPEAVKAVRG